MRQIIFITLCFFVLLSRVYSQSLSFVFAGNIGSTNSNDQYPTDIAYDTQGNMYLCGYIKGLNLDFDLSGTITPSDLSTGNNGSNTDAFLAKYNGTGTLLWAKNLTKCSAAGKGKAYSLALDGSGNIYIGGYYQGTDVDFDLSGTKTILDMTSSGTDAFIAKYTNDGKFIWAKDISRSAAGESYVTDLAVNASGVYATGTYSGMDVDFDLSGTKTTADLSSSSSGADHNVFIAHYSDSGTYVWARGIGKSNAGSIHTDASVQLALDASGNIYIGGSFQGANHDFDLSGTVSPTDISAYHSVGNSAMDGFIARYTSAGLYVWAANIGSSSGLSFDCRVRSIALDGPGNILITGYFSGTKLDFDLNGSVLSGDLSSSRSGNDQNVYLAKYKSSGEYIWAKNISNTNNITADAYYLTTDASDDIYVTGSFKGNSPVDFDLSGDVSDGDIVALGNTDAFIVKYDQDCTYQWGYGIGSSSGGNNIGYGIRVDPGYNIYTCGSFRGINVDFNLASGTYNLSAKNNRYDIYFMKYQQCIKPDVPVIAGTTSICSGSSTNLSISAGALKAATAWKWYTGGCGVTAVSTGMSINVSPLVSTDYYVRGEGNCITSGPCQKVAVTVNSLPVVSAGPDRVVCAGNVITLAGSGASTYSWNQGISNNVPFFPLTTQTYTITGTDVNGCSNTDEIMVTVNSVPIVTAGPDLDVCSGNSVTLNGSGALTYSWDNGIVNGGAFTPVATQTYSVTGTDANNCSNTDHVTVTVHSLPSVSAGQDQTVCKGGNVTLAGSGALNYSWDNRIINGVPFVPMATQTFTVTGTDANNCSSTAKVTITVNTCTGISNSTLPEGIKIYPNPAAVFLHADLIFDGVMEIYDSEGKKVRSQVVSAGETDCSLAGLGSGSYMIHIVKESTGEIYKTVFVKE